ncbi:hypothetical protein EVA_09552 [gut metagenome]|uniref:Uncharacterized protein n=1 Tax=gut metagenome TaxID=749906 RepID=J9GQJ9_9ZZZZ
MRVRIVFIRIILFIKSMPFEKGLRTGQSGSSASGTGRKSGTAL